MKIHSSLIKVASGAGIALHDLMPGIKDAIAKVFYDHSIICKDLPGISNIVENYKCVLARYLLHGLAGNVVEIGSAILHRVE